MIPTESPAVVEAAASVPAPNQAPATATSPPAQAMAATLPTTRVVTSRTRSPTRVEVTTTAPAPPVALVLVTRAPVAMETIPQAQDTRGRKSTIPGRIKEEATIMGLAPRAERGMGINLLDEAGTMTIVREAVSFLYSLSDPTCLLWRC